MSGQLKEVRERITSVKSTQQITKAMKMVSAAKLRKAQQAITEMRPYADRLNKMLVNILSNLEGGADTAFGQEREINNVAIADSRWSRKEGLRSTQKEIPKPQLYRRSRWHIL